MGATGRTRNLGRAANLAGAVLEREDRWQELGVDVGEASSFPDATSSSRTALEHLQDSASS
eukprot:4826022-Prymnesium_polylepis.1